MMTGEGDPFVRRIFEALEKTSSGVPVLNEVGAQAIEAELDTRKGDDLVRGVRTLAEVAMMLHESHGAKDAARRLLEIADLFTEKLGQLVETRRDEAEALRRSAAMKTGGMLTQRAAPRFDQPAPVGTFSVASLTPPRRLR